MPRSGPGPAILSPSISIDPVSTGKNPPIRYSSVDLPQPDGPSKATNSRLATSSETWSSASTSRPRGGRYRSEERRVGKEGRSRGRRSDEKKKGEATKEG